MSACSCEASPEAPTEEMVEAEKSEALEEPVMESDLDKADELYKDMEATLGKLKEIMAYLEEMKDEKMDHEEKAEHEEEKEEDAEKMDHEEKMEEEEKAAHEEEKMDHKKKDTIDELHKSLTTLKKYGINVYSGSRKTPAPKKIDTPAVTEKTDWFNFSKSLDEVAHMKGEETKI